MDPHYEIVASIGVGAYGLVCSAVDLRLVPTSEHYNQHLLTAESEGNFVVKMTCPDGAVREFVPPKYLTAGFLVEVKPVPTLMFEGFSRKRLPNGKVSPAVAIKKVPKVLDDLVDGRRILRELKILRYLSGHPNIVRLLDVMCPATGKTPLKDIYLVTELMDTDLYALLKSNQRIDIHQIRFVAYQLIKALVFAHSSGVIHRDVKPANILLDADCTAKLCDFGLARGGVTLRDPESSPRPAPSMSEFEKFRFNAAEDGTMEKDSIFYSLTDYVVTRYYRAPELLILGKYNHAVDMWSVGCIIAEMISRRTLFMGANYLSQLTLILETPGILGIPTCEKDVDNLFEGGEEGKIFMKDILFGSTRKYSSSLDVFRASVFGSSTLDPDALHLIGSLLHIDPSKRLTAVEALRHPFFKSLYHREDEILRDISGAPNFPTVTNAAKSEELAKSVKVDVSESFLWGFDHQITGFNSLQALFFEEISFYKNIKDQMALLKK